MFGRSEDERSKCAVEQIKCASGRSSLKFAVQDLII